VRTLRGAVARGGARAADALSIVGAATAAACIPVAVAAIPFAAIAALDALITPAFADSQPGSPPQRLADTGLDPANPAVVPFSPQYPLWSDGATKRRWIARPAGSAIDASRPAVWQFPRGTRLWKEFAVDGRPVETRFIERLADGEWRYVTYVWNDAGTDAVLAPAQGMSALKLPNGGTYAVPSQADCRACHEGAPTPVLGFSALQLSADRDPLAPHAEPRRAGEPDLRALIARGLLRGLPQRLVETPPRIAAPTPTARAALGYLHGNCGHCHVDPATADAAVPVGLTLAIDASDPDAGAKTLRALAEGRSRFRASHRPGARHVAPGDPAASVLVERMRSRDPRVQMPPLGTSVPDAAALALVERWIAHDFSTPTQETSP
jgi:hypothetical protein